MNNLKFFITLYYVLFSSFAFCNLSHEELVKREVLILMRESEIPGIAIAFYDEGKEHLFSFGIADTSEETPMTPHTLFDIGSVTKVFTSTALAVEVLNGKMALSDSVETFIFPARLNVKGSINQVTLQDLATHTSSLPRIPPFPHPYLVDKNEVLNFLKSWRPSYPIGTRYVYSNLGFGVIGYALEGVENKSYYEIIRELILNPLEMRSTVIIVPEHLRKNYAKGYTLNGEKAPFFQLNAWPAGGALRSTSSDLLKFLKANLQKDGPIELMKAMQLAQRGIFKVNEHLILGLAWQRFKSNQEVVIIDKNGGVPGFSSYIGMLANRKIGLVILTNKRNEKLTEVGRKILENLSREVKTDEVKIH